VLPAVVLGVILAVAFVASIGLRASRGASITGDEPFYLLTTQSLIDDGDLDLRQQFERRSYEVFFDHEDGLWRQSVPRPDGVLLSPHDPGLSVLVIPGFAIAGLVGVQVQLLAMAAATFALAFVLARAVTGAATWSWWASLAVGLCATPFVYATEIYPEAPAALALVGSLLVIVLGPRRIGVGRAVAVVVLLSAIPWLGVKYLPLSVVVGAWLLWRATARARVVAAGLAAASSAAFIGWHLAVFDGLTPYGVNTVFAGGSTSEIVGQHVSFGDRAYRLWGIFVDRRFGIGRWAPLLLLAVPGSVLAWRRRGPARLVAVLIAVQLGIATFVVITMMGWWFPGRTMMTVLPLFAIPIVEVWRKAAGPARAAIVAAAGWSALTTVLLAFAGHRQEVAIAVDPFTMTAAPFQLAAGLFPDYRAWTAETWVLTGLWLVAAGASVAWARSTRLDPEVVGQVRTEGGDDPADVERQGAVGATLRDRERRAGHQPVLLEEPHHVELELEVLGETPERH
jgi:hypothetical protein